MQKREYVNSNMAFCKARVLDEDKFSEAINTACFLLLRRAKGSSQKILRRQWPVFQRAHGLPKVVDFPNNTNHCWCLTRKSDWHNTVLTVSPLLSLIKDQVKHVNDTYGISAAGIFDGQEEEILQNIEDGVYSLLYTTPEGLLGNKRWRTLASSEIFRQQCVAIVVDECIIYV